MFAPFLEVCDLRKAFGPLRALDGVSFEVNSGEIFGLLGPNGAGKTTLLSIVASLRQADAGVVRIAGQILQQKDRAVRRRVGIAPQELALYGELTAGENLRFFGELYGIPRNELEERIPRILSTLGLEDRAGQRVSSFSGGMQRRLNLGAAVVHEPSLLLLDEPTAGVDAQSRNRLFEEIRRLNVRGMTIVYTSHYMEEVQALCSRVGIIDHGKLIACDTTANLLRLLPARIRFRTSRTDDALRERLAHVDHAKLQTCENGLWELECNAVAPTLTRLLGELQSSGADLTFLETEEPNLEKVFLHLTGRGLRD